MKQNEINILTDLINIISWDKIGKNHEIIHYLETAFKDCEDRLKICTENGSTHLIVGVNCKLENLDKCIILSGHIDTAYLDENYSGKASISNDKIFGSGAGDMKSFWASIIGNINELKSINYPIVLSITSDEETDFQGIFAINKSLKSCNIQPSFIIIGEPTKSKLSISSKGSGFISCDVYGKSQHASNPEYGINAINLASKIIKVINDLNEDFEKFSLCVTRINGGSAFNVVPDKCSIFVDARYSRLDVWNEIIEKLNKEIAKITPSYSLNFGSSCPPLEERVSTFIQKFSKENKIDIIKSNFSTEGGCFQQNFKDAEIVIFGVGEPENIHSKNECIDTKNLKNYSKTLIKMIKDFISI